MVAWRDPSSGFPKRQGSADLISVFRSLISGSGRRLRIPSPERRAGALPVLGTEPLGIKPVGG